MRFQRIHSDEEERRSSGRIYVFTDGTWRFVVELRPVEGSWQPIGFDVRACGPGLPSTPHPLTARELRLPFGELVDLARSHLRVDLARGGPKVFRDSAGHNRVSIDDTAAERGVSRAGGPRVGRPRIPQADLERAAAVYRSAVEMGSRSPVLEVAEKLLLSRSTAARWIQRARDEGLLSPPD